LKFFFSLLSPPWFNKPEDLPSCRLNCPYTYSEPAWINREKSVLERLRNTHDEAMKEKNKAAYRATWMGWGINIAIGLQVFFGALTTALGAALSGKRSSIAISTLGGASTLVASVLARAQGSNEPDGSLLRAKALKHFLREIDAFVLDHGHEIGHKWDDKVNGFRHGLENMLGNRLGSVTIHPGAAINGGQDKELGAVDPTTGLSGNGATNAKLGPGMV